MDFRAKYEDVTRIKDFCIIDDLQCVIFSSQRTCSSDHSRPTKLGYNSVQLDYNSVHVSFKGKMYKT